MPSRRVTDGDAPIRIGISSCLLGAKVRFDGGHKRDELLTGTLGRWVQWVPVCPEVEIGMGTPRETVQLVRAGLAVRMVGTESGADWTAAMCRYTEKRARELAAHELCGFVLEKSSPSCGMERVKVYGEGRPTRSGRGLFATALMRRYPTLPVEEEGRLGDPILRDNFIERVFAYHRLRRLFTGRWKLGDLMTFHTYERELMRALAVIADRRRHTDVLLHIAGCLERRLGREEERALRGLIADYRRGRVPLVAPVTLIRHHVRIYEVAYLAGADLP